MDSLADRVANLEHELKVHLIPKDAADEKSAILEVRPAAGGDEAKRAFDAMMNMRKIDVAAIKAARRG